MKLLQTIFLGLMLVFGEQIIAQEATPARKLPIDPETNCQVRYYYYPNLEAYFDKGADVYIFKDKGEWKKEKDIPSGYRGYGLFNKANVGISDYDEDDITQFFEKHRKLYPYNSLKRNRNSNATAFAD